MAGVTDLAATLLRAYDDHLRGAAEVRGALASGDDGTVVWGRFADGDDGGTVGFVADRGIGRLELDDAALDDLIATTLATVTASGDVGSVEWKTRGHDAGIARLTTRLVAAGFVAEDPETVMVGPAEAVRDAGVDLPLPPEIEIVRLPLPTIDGPDDDNRRWVERALAMQDGVFGGTFSLAALLARVDELDGNCEVWVARTGDAVVSAGRLEPVPGTGFAGLWGGATDPAWRGRGIYRVLTSARADAALAGGARYLQSDCTPMSRPILERSGLTAITTTTPFVWTRPDEADADGPA
jgi:ribosomal protein S18 acetylase RimI-like enzyme